MDEKVRCQSCGMPLGTAEFYGTEANGSENRFYCKFCFQNGSFTKPDMTLNEMIESSVTFMSEKLNFPQEMAQEMSSAIIPTLKRWQK